MLTLQNIQGLGTTWWFELFDLEADQKETLEETITVYIKAFEDNYSRFKDTSYIGRLNAGEKLTCPTPELLELLTLGIHWHQRTDGVFDFLTAAHQEAQGYDANHSFESSATPDKTPLSALSLENGAVALDNGKIDLGGYGKGYLIDMLSRLLRQNGSHEFLINGGGDIFATAQDEAPVVIALEHPGEAGQFIAQVPLHHMALGASSTYKRSWSSKNTGASHSHLLGLSGEDGIATFVLHPRATTADVLATLLAVDPECAGAHLQDTPHLRLEGSRITHSAHFEPFLLMPPT